MNRTSTAQLLVRLAVIAAVSILVLSGPHASVLAQVSPAAAHDAVVRASDGPSVVSIAPDPPRPMPRAILLPGSAQLYAGIQVGGSPPIWLGAGLPSTRSTRYLPLRI